MLRVVFFALMIAAAIALTPVLDSQHMAQRPQPIVKVPDTREEGAATSVYPKLVDITNSTGIRFEHQSSPEQKFIVESMSGGVALIDYDRDGWPDIYFTNAQSVEMALHGKKARSVLYSQQTMTVRSPM